jgi:hypothetical protein
MEKGRKASRASREVRSFWPWRFDAGVTRWEHDFLLGVMAFKSLKPKQVETFDAIRLKIEAATA